MRDQQAFLARLWAIDEALGQRGFPRLSPWWRDTITDFYLSGARQAVVRKGRRVGASTIVAPRIAVCEALYGGHEFSPGDRAVFAFISVRRDEAAKRVKNIEAVLDALGVAYSTSDSTIRLRDRRIDFQVLTASYRTAVGDTCIGVWCDEVARWTDVESGANPAREVLASIRPTIATLPNARLWMVSSPLGKMDAHFDAFEQGDSELQRCYVGATWQINPTLPKAECRALELHDPTFWREYGAIPSDGGSEAFFAEQPLQMAVQPGCTTPEPPLAGVVYYPAADFAFAALGDNVGVAVSSHQVGAWDCEAQSRRPPVVKVHEVHAQRPTLPSEMIRRIRDDVLRRYDERRLLIDQAASHAMTELCYQAGVVAVTVPWTGGDREGSKLDRFKSVRTGMLNGTVKVPDDPELLRELRRVRSVITASGERVELPRQKGNHCDRVAAMVLSASEALRASPCLAPAKETTFERQQREYAERALSLGAFGAGSPGIPGLF